MKTLSLLNINLQIPLLSLLFWVLIGKQIPDKQSIISNSPYSRDTSHIKMTTTVDNIYLCPDKKTVYLSVNLQADSSYSRIPLNLSVVLDRSSSMGDEGKMQGALEGLEHIIDQLDSLDVLSIVTYDHLAHAVYGPLPVTNKTILKERIKKIYPKGSTDIGAGLGLGINKAKEGYDSSKINQVFLLTDGFANEGIRDEATFDLITGYHYKYNNIKCSSFGLGRQYNQTLMQGLATAGGGYFYHIEKPEDVDKFFGFEFNKSSRVAGENAQISIQFPSEQLKVLDVLGYNADTSTNQIIINLKEIHPNQQVRILIPFELKKEVAAPLDFITTLNYEDAIHNKKIVVTQQQSIIQSENPKDCEGVNDIVADEILWFKANDCLNYAVLCAEMNHPDFAQNSIEEGKSHLQKTKKPDANYIQNQLSLLDTFSQQLKNWDKKSFDEKAAFLKEMRYLNGLAKNMIFISQPN